MIEIPKNFIWIGTFYKKGEKFLPEVDIFSTEKILENNIIFEKEIKPKTSDKDYIGDYIAVKAKYIGESYFFIYAKKNKIIEEKK